MYCCYSIFCNWLVFVATQINNITPPVFVAAAGMFWLSKCFDLINGIICRASSWKNVVICLLAILDCIDVIRGILIAFGYNICFYMAFFAVLMFDSRKRIKYVRVFRNIIYSQVKFVSTF